MQEDYFGLPKIAWLMASLLIISHWFRRTQLGRNAFLRSPLQTPIDRVLSLLGFKGNWKAALLTAPVYSFTFFGLSFGILGLTIVIGAALGYDQIQRHATLEQLSHTRDLNQIVLICFNAAIVSPFCEEFFFRGLIQSGIIMLITIFYHQGHSNQDLLQAESRPKMIPNNIIRWIGILLASFYFATCHENRQHWPALFALAVGLGYSYEKQGNLFSPFVIHALFNALVLTVNLCFPEQS